ncbi:MAG: hypothetical protein GC160_21000 [Acidobacteria bacterium]|nr:hypothetical protein [Acidobacteriota bacterium]
MRRLVLFRIRTLPVLISLLFGANSLWGSDPAAPRTVVSSASFEATVAPGSLATLFGRNLAPESMVATPDDSGGLPTNLGEVSVEIDGRLAPLLFVSPTQINFFVPEETSLGTVGLIVLVEGAERPADPQLTVSVARVAPAIFEAGCLLPDRAAALNAVTFAPGPFQTESAGSSVGEPTYLSLFGTGIRAANAVVVEILDRTGGVTPVEPTYVGPAPGFAGLDQINFAIPAEFEGVGVAQLRLRVDGTLSNLVSIDISNASLPTFDPREYTINTVAGTGAPGYTGDGLQALRATLQEPHDVALGRRGELYVADTLNHVVRVVSSSGSIATFAGTGDEGSAGDGDLAVDAQLTSPRSVAVGPRGAVYIADPGAQRVRKVDTHGVITTFAGTGVEGAGEDGGSANAAQLSSPSGVAVNSFGSVLIADTGNHRILLVTADGMIQTIAGTGVAGDSGDGGPAIAARLHGPTSLDVSALNVIVVADSGNEKVRQIEPSGLIRTIIGEGDNASEEEPNLGAALSVAFGLHERLMVSDAETHRLWVDDLDCVLHPLAGQGHPGASGEGTPAVDAELNAPAGSTSTLFGDFLLADAGNNRVRRLWRRLGSEDTNCGEAAAIAFGPSLVIGGEQAVGFVRLNCPTDHDVTVVLSSDATELAPPASVTIPAGALMETFEVETPPVEEALVVTVTATTGGGSTAGTLTIVPGHGPGINSLTIAAGTVIGGQTTVGRVWLGSPAPAGGLRVALSTSQSAASTAPEIIVPEGAISAEFLIATEPVESAIQAVVRGEAGETSAAATLVILPEGSASEPALLSLTVSPGSISGGGQVTGTVTLEGPAPEGGLEVFLSSSTNRAVLPDSIVIPGGATSAQFSIQTSPVTQLLVAVLQATARNTVQATLTLELDSSSQDAQVLSLTIAPNPVVGGQSATGTVELASPAPSGGIQVTLASNNAAATVPSSVSIPEAHTTGQFTISTTPATTQQVAMISATSANTVSTALTIDASGAGLANLASLTLAPTTVSGGQSSTGTVTLGGPAATGGVLVNLSSDNPTATVPASIVIPEGQTSGQFVVMTSPAATQQTVGITAASANSLQASLTIDPTPAGSAQLGGLSLSPNPVKAGQASTGTIILLAPAPSGGVLVNLTSDNSAASVPASVVIPEGQTSGQFQVTTSPSSSAQAAGITATSSNSVSASLSIQPTAAGRGQLSGLTLSPNPVLGGQSSTATVTLSSPAGLGGILVQLGSDSVNATAPASITIPQGQTSGQFSVTTSPVGSQQTAGITATSANAVTATMTISATPAGSGQIAGLTLNPTSVVGGQSSTGTVTLSGAAPVGGVLVNFSSDNSSASAPPSLVIPQGQTSAQFTVTTLAVGSQQSVAIAASSANSVSATLTLTPTAAGSGQLAGLTLAPSSVDGGQSSTGTVTLASAAPVGGVLVNLSSANATASVPATITIPAGQTAGQFTATTSPTSTQVSAVITATSANAVSGTLTIKATPASSGQIVSLALAPTAVDGGQSSTATVTLSGAAPAGGVQVSLTSDSASATLPATLLIPQGQTIGQFTVATSPVGTQQSVQVTATSANAVSRTLTINAASAGLGQISDLALSPTSVAGGNNSMGTVTLATAAPIGGVLVNLTSGNANATLPASITIPQGQTSGQFTVATAAVASQQTASISATSANAVNRTLTITATGAGQGQIAGLSLNPTSVAGGNNSTGTVTLATAAPIGGVLVNLTSGNANATLPASITIPQGQTSGQFTVATAAVASQQTASITATSANAVNKTLTITSVANACVGSLTLNASITDVLSGAGLLSATATLDGPAAQGGSQIQLIRSGANIGVINIGEGQTSGSVDLTIANLLTIVGSTVQAVLGDCPGVMANITLGTPVTGTITNLTLNPSTVPGGDPSTGTVTIGSAAPAGGTLVNLSSGNANAVVPASIAIAQGQTSAQFTVTTSATASQQTVLITATSANSVNQTLTITATGAGQGQIAGLTLDPASVTGGNSSTGTVTLSAVAPIGGVLVTLSSGNANATLPGSIVIAQGQTSGQFAISTATVASQQTALITVASANSVHQTLTIDPVQAACVNSLLLNASISDLLSGSGVLSATATLDGPAPQSGSQIQLVRSGANVGVINIPEGQTSGSVDLTIANLLSIVGSSVQAVLNGCPAVVADITLGSPITGTVASVVVNPTTVFAGAPVTGTVTLTTPAGSNGVLVGLSTDNSSATILSSSVVVPAGQTTTTFPISTVNTSAYPVVVAITGTSGSSSQSASLTINSSNPCVEALQLTANISNLVTGEGVLNSFVTLTGPAPAGGANVPLLIGDTQVGQVVIPANQSTGAVGITVANLPTLLGSVVRAVLGPCGVNATVSVSIPVLGSIVVPASLTLGQSGTGTVVLNQPAPEGGATVSLSETPLGLVGDLLNALLGSVVIPSSVTVPEGQTEANFSISSSVLGGVLGLLLPNEVSLQIDALLQSAFGGNTVNGVVLLQK